MLSLTTTCKPNSVSLVLFINRYSPDSSDKNSSILAKLIVILLVFND